MSKKKSKQKEEKEIKKVKLLTKNEIIFWAVYIIFGLLLSLVLYFWFRVPFLTTFRMYYGFVYMFYIPGFFIYKTIFYYLNKPTEDYGYMGYPVGISVGLAISSILIIAILIKVKITLLLLFSIFTVVILISLLFYYLRYKKVL